MSFTTDIKSELCHVPVADETAMAECLGISHRKVFPSF